MNDLLAWETVPGSSLVNRGEVTFEPGPDGTGTEVRLHMQFEPPLGTVGAEVMKALDMIPQGIAGQALRRFKSLVETGEIPTLRHNVSGRGTRTVSPHDAILRVTMSTTCGSDLHFIDGYIPSMRAGDVIEPAAK